MCKEKQNTEKDTDNKKFSFDEKLENAYHRSKKSGYKKIIYPSKLGKESAFYTAACTLYGSLAYQST